MDLDISDLNIVEYQDIQDLVIECVPLSDEDLAVLAQTGPSRSQPTLKHMRAHHHTIAIQLATGTRAVDICAQLGLTPQTLTKLQKDPQFQLLVEGYRGDVVTKAIDTVELMGLALQETVTAIHEQLVDDDSREMIPLETLRRTLETLADRTGHSPVRRSEALNRNVHEIGRETLDRIKALHGEDTTYQAETIEAQVISSHEEESRSIGAGTSIASAFRSVEGPEAADLTTAEGADV